MWLWAPPGVSSPPPKKNCIEVCHFEAVLKATVNEKRIWSAMLKLVLKHFFYCGYKPLQI